MNLYTILGQDTLPEQVEKNKQNIAILAEEVDKLGFTPKGVYDADTEYNYNDLVFYDEKMYAVISEVAIVGVLPTNTTYWQQVTGSIMGQQGPQGIQGPQGPAGADGQDGQDGTNGTDGTDGVDALVYTAINSFYNMGIGSIIQLANAYFNRTPELGEKPVVYAVDSGNGHKYLLTGSISNVGSSASSYMIGSLTQIDGLQGADGQPALCYDRNIAFTRTEDAEQLISVTLPFANFNRTPELNEDFVGILEDSGVCYVAQCEVQTISGTNVTSIVAIDINRITGADGQNGTNGTDGTNGKDALVYGAVLTDTFTPNVNDNHGGLLNIKMNRTPVVDDLCVVPYRNTSNNKTYLMTCKITAVFSSDSNYTITGVSETTGTAGPSGTTLTEHAFSEIQLTSTTTAGKLYRIIRNAKGNLSTIGYFTANSKTFRFVNSISAISNSIRIYCPAVSDGTETLTVNVNVSVPNWTSSSAFTVYDSSGNLVTTNGLNVYGYYYNDSEIS